MGSWQYINPQSHNLTGYFTTSKPNWWRQTSQKPWSWYTSDQLQSPLLAYCFHILHYSAMQCWLDPWSLWHASWCQSWQSPGQILDNSCFTLLDLTGPHHLWLWIECLDTWQGCWFNIICTKYLYNHGEFP